MPPKNQCNILYPLFSWQEEKTSITTNKISFFQTCFDITYLSGLFDKRMWVIYRQVCRRYGQQEIFAVQYRLDVCNACLLASLKCWSSELLQEEYNDSYNLVEYFFCCNILLSTYLSSTTSNGPPTQKIRNCHGMFFMCWRLVRKLGLLRVVVSSGRVRKSQIYELFALVICRFAKQIEVFFPGHSRAHTKRNKNTP